MAQSLQEKLAAIQARVREVKAIPTPSFTKQQAIQEVVRQANAQQSAMSAHDTGRAKLIALGIIKLPVSVPLPQNINGVNVTLHPVAPELQNFNKNQVTYDMLDGSQKLAFKLALAGESFCLIGGAGTGKTTIQRLILQALDEKGFIHYDTFGVPSVIVVSYTNPAVANIKSALPEKFKTRCQTIHKTLAYKPEQVWSDKQQKQVRIFTPEFTAENPLLHVSLCVVEESGTVGLALHRNLELAIEFQKPQFIYLGDLQQLPPAFGDGILGFKLLELPVVKLNRIYRTGDESPIRKLSYAIQDGKEIRANELLEMQVPGALEFYEMKKAVQFTGDDKCVSKQFGALFYKMVKSGEFKPLQDVLLIPFNKNLGTIELGKYIAQAHAELNGQDIHQIIAGYNKHYYAIGDIVYLNKRKYLIEDIQLNPKYMGDSFLPAEAELDRWGIPKNLKYANLRNKIIAENQQHKKESDNRDLFESLNEDIEATHQASHEITLSLIDDPQITIKINAAAEFNGMYFAHTLTIYKAQGSEWGRVFCIFHESHNIQGTRETLYTACTRARDYLKIFYHGENTGKFKADSIWIKWMRAQRIPGKTTEEKLEHFKRKIKLELLQMKLLGEEYHGDQAVLPPELLRNVITKIINKNKIDEEAQKDEAKARKQKKDRYDKEVDDVNDLDNIPF